MTGLGRCEYLQRNPLFRNVFETGMYRNLQRMFRNAFKTRMRKNLEKMFRNVFETGMYRNLQKALLFLMLTACVPAWASTATDFYLDLLARGTAEVDAGRYGTSVTPLRLAAFGLVDSIEHYETALAYLAVAHDKLGQQEEARRAAQRVVAAEGVEKKFATLALPASIRTAFATIAKKLLSAPDAAALTSPPPTPTQPKQTGTAIVPPTRAPAKTQPAATPTVAPTQTAPRNEKPKTTAPTQGQNGGAQKPAVTEKPKTTPPAPGQNNGTQKPAVTEKPKTTPPAPGQNNGTQKPPVSQKPEPVNPPKVVEAPKPAATPATTAPKPATPPTTKPQPAQAQPQPAQARATPTQPARVDVPARLTAGERALSAANLAEARRIYGELLTVPSLERNAIIRIGEGLYRSRDFAQALAAFLRLGTLRAGEEAYRYYIAVALFETGDVAAAKREMTAALPFIEITPDVQRYRQKVEGAQN